MSHLYALDPLPLLPWNVVKDVFRFQADVLANLVTIKVMIVGYAWIWWGWRAALLAFGAMVIAKYLLADTFYKDMLMVIPEEEDQEETNDG